MKSLRTLHGLTKTVSLGRESYYFKSWLFSFLKERLRVFQLNWKIIFKYLENKRPPAVSKQYQRHE